MPDMYAQRENALGLTVRSISSDVSAVTLGETIHCRSLGPEIPPGSMTGTIDRTVVATKQGPSFEFTMEGRIYRDGGSDSNHWKVMGEPNLELKCSEVNYRFTTCSTLVNRIPDVIAANPGLRSLDRLGPPSDKHHWSLRQARSNAKSGLSRSGKRDETRVDTVDVLDCSHSSRQGYF